MKLYYYSKALMMNYVDGTEYLVNLPCAFCIENGKVTMFKVKADVDEEENGYWREVDPTGAEHDEQFKHKKRIAKRDLDHMLFVDAI
jgi:protein associated with RNAse G/E